MPALYVTEPGAVVRFRTGSLIVTRDEKEDAPEGERNIRKCLLEVEPHHVETIALVGRVHMTARATRLCLDKGIPVSWMSRNGRLLGRLVPELSRTADLRLLQYRLFEDADARLALGRLFIEAKIANAAALLSALRSNRSGVPQFGTAIADLETLRSRAASADDQNTLMGIEGDAARRYFNALGMGFSGLIGFSGRQKRPPPDPANALLSFGYVLLANLIASLLEARGFDPLSGHAARRPVRAPQSRPGHDGGISACRGRPFRPAHMQQATICAGRLCCQRREGSQADQGSASALPSGMGGISRRSDGRHGRRQVRPARRSDSGRPSCRPRSRDGTLSAPGDLVGPKMRYVVCYDIADNARRRRVAEVLDAHGDRMQESVFEIAATDRIFRDCLEELTECINSKEDRLAIYSLCASCDRNTIYIGVSSDAPRTGEEPIFLV